MTDQFVDTCRDCTMAAWILRRLGFRDTISWGSIGPSGAIHAIHANSGMPEITSPDVYKDAIGVVHVQIPARTQVGSALPLCTSYRSELAWVTAGRCVRMTVYMGHPVAEPDFNTNVRNAGLWLQFLRSLSAPQLSELTGVRYYTKPLILAPWLGGILPDEVTPGGREVALADCRDTVTLFDEFWCMARVSEGMRYESTHAKVVRDLTHLGELPPIGAGFQHQRQSIKTLNDVSPKNGTKPRKR